MPYKLKKDAAEYMRNYRKLHPEILRENTNKKRQQRHERKLFAIRYKGGKCQKCGYMRNLSALEFHHPNGKDIAWKIEKNFLRWSEKRFLEELEKVILLCSNCHQEEHHPELVINNGNGP